MATNPVVPTGTKTNEEKGREQSSSLSTMVEIIKENERKRYEAQMTAELAELTRPDRSELPELTPSGYNRVGEPVHRLESPTLSMYRYLPEAERKWRNPDSDHYMAEWMRGNLERDHARMLLAVAKLDAMFPGTAYRADLLEGVVGASGAFATGTGATLIPRPLAEVVMIARDRVAKGRRFVSIIQMQNQTINVPTAASMTAAMAAENTTSAQGEPTISQVQLAAMKCQAKAVSSRELLDDAPINLISIIASRGGAAIAVVEDNEIFKDGTGTAPHINRMSGTSYAETTSTFLSYGDMLSMYYTLPQEYMDGAIWLAASNVLQYLSGVRDSTGRPLYQGLLEAPAPIQDDPTAVGTIFGRPVYRVPYTAGTISFGDPRAQYVLGDRQGIEMRVSEHIKFDVDAVMWLITERFAGNNVDNSASQYCTGITSATSV